jgi:hypothetical protein
MGCWNGTCVISGLAIRAGEQAVALPVTYDEHGTAGIFFPIFGEYNDYGSLENVQSNRPLEQLLALINKRGLAPKIDRAEFKAKAEELNKAVEATAAAVEKESTNGDLRKAHNVAYMAYINHTSGTKFGQVRFNDLKGACVKDPSKGIPDVDSFVTVMERSGLGPHLEIEVDVFHKGPTWRNISMILVHRKVWDAIVKRMHEAKDHTVYSFSMRNVPDEFLAKYNIPKDSWTDMSIKDYFDFKWDLIKHRMQNATFDDVVLRMADSLSSEDSERVCKLFNEPKRKYIPFEELAFLGEQELNSIKQHAVKGAFGYDGEGRILFDTDPYISYDPILVDEMAEMVGENIEDTEWKEALFNLYMMNRAMHAMRKRYDVMPGAGSQADNFEVVQAVAKATLAVCKKRQREKERDAEDD